MISLLKIHATPTEESRVVHPPSLDPIDMNGLSDDIGNMILEQSKGVVDMFKVQRNAVRNLVPGGVFEP